MIKKFEYFMFLNFYFIIIKLYLKKEKCFIKKIDLCRSNYKNAFRI